MQIHPTAIVSPDAELAEDVVIEAYSIIGPKVSIGSGTVVGPHVVIEGKTSIGVGNRIYPFVTIGFPPQDITYRGEETAVVIGNDNIIRENITIHRGSTLGDGITRIGDSNYLMAYVHVAHDCRIGTKVIMANATTLGGHVEVGDCAVIGGVVVIHQFVRIGEYSCLGGRTGVRMDIPPYMLASGTEGAKLFGPNIIGLRRNGFAQNTISALKKCYRIIFRSGLTVEDALEKVRREVEPLAEVERLVDFVSSSSKRGLTR
ncbi:MAG: acyl-ACP--UDP-N-acetylglucosamine O-acyltransferase [Syntrophobacteraceae bacterium]